MNRLLLTPTDVLFFRDGRPMGGSLAGHGAAWPLPTVTNAALHAALHRADIAGVHSHRRGRSGNYSETRHRKFGSLVTAGPFPVTENGEWLFPRPLDAGIPASTEPSFLPLKEDLSPSSLPPRLKFPVANTAKPSKEPLAPWWNAAAWRAYEAPASAGRDAEADPAFFNDSDLFDTEHQIGIGIDPATGTQDGKRFYSAHYLRLRPDRGLGLLAEARDKDFRDKDGSDDLLHPLFRKSDSETPVLVGGQQRLCTVRRDIPEVLPLPRGRTSDFTRTEIDGEARWLVKWALLSPAIFPAVESGVSKRGTERQAHPGGWLPTWISPDRGRLLLQAVTAEERKRRRGLNASGKGYESIPDIDAFLVAAMTGKPVPVSGYALAVEENDRPGHKPTLLAVPAGSVYYFACGTSEAAEKLAAALNWHASDDFSAIRNRRSTLLGEKGFGLGVCSTWRFHDGKLPT